MSGGDDWDVSSEWTPEAAMVLDSDLLAAMAAAGLELDVEQLEEVGVWMRQRIDLHRTRHYVDERVRAGAPLVELLAALDRRIAAHQAARPWRQPAA